MDVSPELPVMDPDHSVLREPERDGLKSFITPSDGHYVLAALGVPRVEADDWAIDVVGDVDRPRRFLLEELGSMRQVAAAVTLECAGNPLNPDKPLRRVSTANWSGVAIADLLTLVGPREGAEYVWIDGVDHGVYRPGTEAAERVTYYRKDVPLERIVAGGGMLATRMNGAHLPREHGYPVRAIIPGYYGTNSVKWVNRITVSRGRPAGLFASVLYNDPVVVNGAIERRQTGPIAVNSVIVSHSDGDVLPVGRHRISGWAWGDTTVASVTLDIERVGAVAADVRPRIDHAWQRFEADVDFAEPGEYRISARASDTNGRSQPDDEHINQCMTITVRVTG